MIAPRFAGLVFDNMLATKTSRKMLFAALKKQLLISQPAQQFYVCTHILKTLDSSTCHLHRVGNRAKI